MKHKMRPSRHIRRIRVGRGRNRIKPRLINPHIKKRIKKNYGNSPFSDTERHLDSINKLQQQLNQSQKESIKLSDEFYKLMKFYDKQPPTDLRGDNLVKWERQKLNVNQTLSNLSHEKTIKLKEIGRLRDTIKEEKGFLE